LGAENREGGANIGECYLHVACGPPYLLRPQIGGSSVDGKPFRTYVDVVVAELELKGFGEFEDNVRRKKCLMGRGHYNLVHHIVKAKHDSRVERGSGGLTSD
jgi:hypothetical protein